MTPLNAARVLVTRPAHQAANLCRLIESQGGIAVRFPTLAILALPDARPIRAVLANLGKFQWLIFVSANAVNFALQANGGKIPQLNSPRIAAIGQATAQALAAAGCAVDLLPTQGFNSEALLASEQWRQVEGQRFLIVRGQGGREELAAQLRQRGAKVDYLEVYQRTVPPVGDSEAPVLLAQGRLAAITITSGEALRNLLIMIAPQHHSLLQALPIIVVGGRVAQLASELGFKQIVVAAEPADTAIIEAVTMCLTGK